MTGPGPVPPWGPVAPPTRPGVPRPRRAGVPAAAALLAVVVWGVVAHDSGSGWVQTVGGIVTGLLVVGLVGPAVAVWRIRCRVVSSPVDAVAGSPVVLVLALDAPAEVGGAEPPGPAVLTGRSPTAELVVTPARRGVVDAVRVTVASAAPWGLAWWTRSLVLPLPHSLAVAPRAGRPGNPMALPAAGAAAPDQLGTSPAAGTGTEPRGVRPYVYGDRPHLVHWPATAHTGSLMVRETERGDDRQVAVHAELPDDPDAADRAAETLLGTVAALLAAGTPVRLTTREPRGPVDEPVRTLGDAGRRLALALPRTTPGARAGAAPRRSARRRRGAPERAW